MSEPATDRRTIPPHTPRREALAYTESPLLAELLSSAARRLWDSAAFWDAVAEHGTPLVEASDTPGFDIVTFLARGTAEEPATVLLSSKLTDMFAPDETLLRQIEGRDVRALSLRLPSDWVGGYALAHTTEPLASLRSGDYSSWRALSALARRDPFCRRSIEPKPNGPALSLGEASAAPPRPSFGEGAGRWIATEFASAALGGSREVSVYLPAGVAAPERFLVLLDGEVWMPRLPAVLDALYAERALPAVAAVFLASMGPDRRSVDYLPDTPFQQFLIEELPEALRGQFASLAATGHAIAGQSLGGLCAVATASSEAELYQTAIAQSGSFWWPSASAFERHRNLLAQRLSTSRLPLPRVILHCGSLEWETREDSRRLHDVLRARGASVTLDEPSGGHDVAWWERYLPAALPQAFSAIR